MSSSFIFGGGPIFCRADDSVYDSQDRSFAIRFVPIELSITSSFSMIVSYKFLQTSFADKELDFVSQFGAFIGRVPLVLMKSTVLG